MTDFAVENSTGSITGKKKEVLFYPQRMGILSDIILIEYGKILFADFLYTSIGVTLASISTMYLISLLNLLVFFTLVKVKEVAYICKNRKTVQLDKYKNFLGIICLCFSIQKYFWLH